MRELTRQEAIQRLITKVVFVIIGSTIVFFLSWKYGISSLSGASVKIKEDLLKRMFSEVLPILFMMAAILERSTEVFINTWRGPYSARLNLKFVHIGKMLATKITEAANIEQSQHATEKEILEAKTLVKSAEEDLHNAEQDALIYKNQTQRLALWIALTLGWLISLAGFRSLELFFLDVSNLNSNQQIFFHITDVMITGGVIAGGSEGIHKLFSLFNQFMDSTTNMVKRQNERNQ